MPVLMPVTEPVASPTVALLVLPLIHVPPDDVLLSVVFEPTQTDTSPVIAGGAEFTVTIVVRAHELEIVYVIIVVPVVTGDTTPDDEIVATPGVLLVHVPPEGEDESVVLPAGHKANDPVMTAGILLTVISAVTRHPVGRV